MYGIIKRLFSSCFEILWNILHISCLIIQYCCLFIKIYWRGDTRFLALTCWSSVLITAAIVYLYGMQPIYVKKHLGLYSCFFFIFSDFYLSTVFSQCIPILAGTLFPTCFLFRLWFRCRIEKIATTKVKGQRCFPDIWGASPLYFPRGELYLIFLLSRLSPFARANFFW